MANGKFGMFFLLTKILLIVFIIVLMILNILFISSGSHSTGMVLWIIFCFISLGIGLIGIWLEHLLFTMIFSIIVLVLACLSTVVHIWTSALVIIILLCVFALLYLFMLYDMGHRETGLPTCR
ncbi:hypothetical protein SSS_09995 [Sarcoptes scabiei]|nr:hypothetical protein SSS_09995 [Sarcoptes scabiei]